LETRRFSEYDRGILLRLLLDAYAGAPELVERYGADWAEFDSFVYDHLSFMDACGFMAVEDGRAVGFMSWDPRRLPDSVEIGHNCIVRACQSLGKGKEQLRLGLDRIRELRPKKIIVKTGRLDFFLPAQRMYLSAGFRFKRTIERSDDFVREALEYELEIG
jgi:hypothetical protein